MANPSSRNFRWRNVLLVRENIIPSNIYMLLYQRKFKDESLIVLNLKKFIKDTCYNKYGEQER